MEYYLVQFRSRSQTGEFANLLRSYGVQTSVVNTPRQILSSCSLSVKTDAFGMEKAKGILLRRKLDSFQGIYHICQQGFQLQIKQIM